MSDGVISGKVKTMLGRAARNVVHDYRLNWILQSPSTNPSLPLTPDLEVRRFREEDERFLGNSDDEEFRKALGYWRGGATGFVMTEGGEPACAVHFVTVAGYDYSKTWPLAANQLALVNIVTRRASRGRGFAATLITHATSLALQGCFDNALCFVWWNHHASLAAFRQAGWYRVGFSLELVGCRGEHLQIGFPLRLPARPLLRAGQSESRGVGHCSG